jgi:hypothetical protein
MASEDAIAKAGGCRKEIFIFFREGDAGRGIPQWQTTFLIARHALCRSRVAFQMM